jgi:hypothetical protein
LTDHRRDHSFARGTDAGATGFPDIAGRMS